MKRLSYYFRFSLSKLVKQRFVELFCRMKKKFYFIPALIRINHPAAIDLSRKDK